jgi:hypothetical protein
MKYNSLLTTSYLQSTYRIQQHLNKLFNQLWLVNSKRNSAISIKP